MEETNTMIQHGYGYGMNKWMDILSEEAVAPETGIYIFACEGDNHVYHEIYYMQKDERLFKYFECEYGHSDGWFRVVPIAFHCVPDFSLQNKTKDWREFNINEKINLHGYIILALEKKNTPNKLYYSILNIDRDNTYLTWNEYFEKNDSIIHTGNCFFNFLRWDYYSENYSKFHLSEINILSWACVFPCTYV